MRRERLNNEFIHLEHTLPEEAFKKFGRRIEQEEYIQLDHNSSENALTTLDCDSCDFRD